MPPTARQKLAWCLLAPVAAAVVLEVAVRALDAAPPQRPPIQIWGEQEAHDVFRKDAQHRFHTGWLWEPRPGGEFMGGGTDAFGLRGPRYELEPRPQLRILVIGESATFGMGGPDRESWPRVLESDLRARGIDVQVLNYGVIGHTLAQGVERYCRELREWKPNVVVCCYGGRNEQSEVGLDLTDREKIELFDSWSMRTRMALEEHFASVRWCTSALQPAPQSGHGAPPVATVRHRVSIEEYDRLVGRLQQATAEDGAKLVVVLQAYAPWHEASAHVLVEYAEAIQRIAAQHSLPLADVRAKMRAIEPPDAATRTESPLYSDDAHPSAEGARIFAAVVERTLESAKLLPASNAASSGASNAALSSR